MLHVTMKSPPSRASKRRAFLLRRMLCSATLATMGALLPSCIILAGPWPGSSADDGSNAENGSNAGSGANTGSGANAGSGSGMGMPTPPVNRLPRPSIPRADPLDLDADALKRLEEIEQYLFDQYTALGWQILETTQTYTGDIIDWVDPKSIPGSEEEPPPPLPPEELALPPGVTLQQTELDLFPELRGPEGLIPITRPSFLSYLLGFSGATSLEDFLAQEEGGQPMGQKRLYAGYQVLAPNQGVSARVNQFGGDVEPGTFSLIEVATLCRGANEASTLELVGVVASRDRKNFGDAYPRFHIEFFTAGPDTIGDKQGGWDERYKGFVPAAGRPYGPNLPLYPLSILGVSNMQYHSLFHIQRFNGNWWVNHNNHWLGYYPGSLFDLLGSTDPTCEMAWYGEVYDPTPSPWTWTDMGSGLFANTGLGSASFVWNPFYVDLAGAFQFPSAFTVKPMIPMDLGCYTASPMLLDTYGAPYFFLGGPGGDALGGGCK